VRSRFMLLLTAVLSLAVSGCVQEYSADQHPCPCADGYICCPYTDTCFESPGPCTCHEHGDCPEGDFCGESGECYAIKDAALSEGRYGHASVVLADGRVLTTGGIRRYVNGIEEILATAEIFDPATGEQRIVLGPGGQALKMHASSGRAFHTMTLLRDGEVLIAGGVGPIVQGASTVRTALRSAEIFDPDTETFLSPMDMGSGRAHHTATMLATGQVLVAGGATYGNNGAIDSYLDTGVIFDPSNDTWTPVSDTMSARRAFHQAVLLDPAATGGKVIMIGGENSTGTLGSADIFDPNNLSFIEGVDVTMARNRSRFCAVRLMSGLVLVAGGTTLADDPATPDVFERSPDDGVEIYDTNIGAYGAFLPDGPNLLSARLDLTCSLIADGQVLVAGGLTADGTGDASLELISEQDQDVTVSASADSLAQGRYAHTALTLRDGGVMIIGGLPDASPDSVPIAQCEIE